jgi:hypothetical protein
VSAVPEGDEGVDLEFLERKLAEEDKKDVKVSHLTKRHMFFS